MLVPFVQQCCRAGSFERNTVSASMIDSVLALQLKTASTCTGALPLSSSHRSGSMSPSPSSCPFGGENWDSRSGVVAGVGVVRGKRVNEAGAI